MCARIITNSGTHAINLPSPLIRLFDWIDYSCFHIQKLHLPPELSESASRTQEEGPLPGQREKTSLQGHGGARIAVGGEGQPQSRATTTSSIRTATKFKVDF